MAKILRRICGFSLALLLALSPVSALSVEQARELLDKHYIDPLPAKAMSAQSLDELLSALGDPYTVYFTAEEYDLFLSSMSDTTVTGIGVSVQGRTEGGVVITTVLDNSPALAAGLVPGDVILAVDGIPVTNVDHAVALISGEVGAPLRLQVLKQDGTTEDLELVRKVVLVTSTVTYSTSQDGTAGLIECRSFGSGTSDRFKQAVASLDDSVNGWIIDLTRNPGGTASATASSAGVFAGSATMVYMRDGTGAYSYLYTLPYVTAKTEKPAIVLTSPYSASGAELFTAAIRDHAVGIAIGARTFGKGVAQVAFDETSHPDLFDGDALKITTYRFFSPAGTTHDLGGLIPTLLISGEHAFAAAQLLCAGEPAHPSGYLNITLAGLEFYIHLDTALSPELRPAFIELLESLPPSASLWMDKGADKWSRTTMDEVLKRLDLYEFVPRTFSDLADCPQANAINTLAVYDLINGYGDGTFRPEHTITRAEFCAMVVNALGITPSGGATSPFYDVTPDCWYYEPVMTMYERGYISGYSDGSFCPSQHIRQEEAACILARTATWLNMRAYDIMPTLPAAEELTELSDYSPWARQSIKLLDMLSMDTSFIAPARSTTRAQAAQLLCDLLRATNVIWPAGQE